MNIDETESRPKLKKEDDLAKIAISKEADRALVELMSRIGDGFDAGRLTKQDIASQIILRFTANYTELDIHAMRVRIFDPILALEAKLKKAKETGIVPDSIRNLMLDEFMADKPASNAKGSKRTLNQNNIKDIVSSNEEAA